MWTVKMAATQKGGAGLKTWIELPPALSPQGNGKECPHFRALRAFSKKRATAVKRRTRKSKY
jgi:hypothetical protein